MVPFLPGGKMQPGPAATIACLGTVAVPSKKVPTHWVRSVMVGSEQASGVQSDSAGQNRMSAIGERERKIVLEKGGGGTQTLPGVVQNHASNFGSSM
jgi:hypothetical protein